MADDKLLCKLGTLAAQQHHEGERSDWERLARGELSPDEIAALERLAAENAPDDMRLAASRPLDESAQERIVDVLAAGIGAARRPVRWRSRAGIMAAGLALAAGALVFVGASRSADLPAYVLDSSGVASSRAPSSAGGPCVLRAGEHGSFELLARPNDAVNDPVVAYAFVVRGGKIQPLERDLEVSPKGSARLLAEHRQLAGATEVRIVVGRPEQLERTKANDVARGSATFGRGWQVLRCPVETR